MRATKPITPLRAQAKDRLYWLVLGILALVLATWLVPVPVRAQEPGPESDYKFKAGYLFNLAKFIDWPESAFARTNTFVVGVLGSADAASAIEHTLRGKVIDGRTFQVKQLTGTTTNPIPLCHILFVSSDAGKSPAELRQALGAAATLLVGDADQFAESGGMVGFERDGNALHLKLNLAAATQSGLKVSAKLAYVARLVTTTKPDH